MRKAALVTAAWICLSPVVASSAEQFGPASAPDARKDAQYTCPEQHPSERVVAGWAAADWDKNRLACAADAWAAGSDAQPRDPALAVHALRATTTYMALVNSFRDEDLYSVHLEEYVARVNQAAIAGERLDARVASLSAWDAEATADRGLYRLQAGHMGPAKDVLKASKAALELLEQAVKAAPGAGDGAAVLALAKLYDTLPEFVGGDPERAAQLLAQGLKVAPTNVGLVRYTAFVAARDRRADEAKARLSYLLGLEPAPGYTQRFVDELKGAAELATRLEATDLAKQLADKRSALFARNASLLRRLPSAVNLHGGVDPLTGKDY